MINIINNTASLWWSWMNAMFWQVGLLIILIACIDAIIKKWAWPQLRYGLWLLVLLKLILPPSISMPGSFAERLKPVTERIASRTVNEPETESLSTTTASEPSATFPAVISSEQPAIFQPQPFGAEYENNAAAVSINQHTLLEKLTWKSYAMIVWILGILMLGLWLLSKLHRLRNSQPQNDSACSIPQSFHRSMSLCARRLKLCRVPHIVVTEKLTCPAVFGVFRPVLLVPGNYLCRLSRKDAEHIIMHELAHIKRGDLIVHCIYLILQIVYWFNPLLWLARRQLIHLRELCCDATVANILRNNTHDYRKTIIDIARNYLTKSVEPGLGLLGLFEDTNRLLVRLHWLEKKTWRYQKMKKVTVLIICVLMTAFVLPMAKAQEQSSTEDHATHLQQTSHPQNENDSGTEQVEIIKQLYAKMQMLEAQFEKLEIERQNLRKELAALEIARQKTKAKEVKDKAAEKSAEVQKKAQQ